MQKILDGLRQLPWHILIMGSLLLGLAPFAPQPHLFEKITFLFNGTLSKPMDIFDLFMHSAFPLLLVLKSLATVFEKKSVKK